MKRQTGVKRSPRRQDAVDLRPADRLTENLFKIGVLLIAVLGFFFSLQTCYRLTVSLPRAVGAAILFVMLSFAVHFHKRWTLPAAAAVWIAFAVFAAARRAALTQGFLLLTEQALLPCNLTLPEQWQALLLPESAQNAEALMRLALHVLLFITAMLSGYFVVRRPNIAGLAAATLPLMLPAPFFSLAPAIIPTFLLVTALFTLSVYNGGKYVLTTVSQRGESSAMTCRGAGRGAQTAARQLLALAVPPLVALTLLMSGLLLPEKTYVRPERIENLKQRMLAFELFDGVGRSNDGLTQGDLNNLSEVQYTGETALKVRVSEDRPLYLRNFAGVLFTANRWSAADGAAYRRYAESAPGPAAQNLFAAAAAASAVSKTQYTLAVQNINAVKSSLFVPNGLITRAEDIEGAAFQADTSLAAKDARGVPVYAMEAYAVDPVIATVPLVTGFADAQGLLSAYEAAAGRAFGLENADAAEVRAAAKSYIDYIFSCYTVLPDDTRQSAEALIASLGLSLRTDGGAVNVFETLSALRNALSARCAYAYDPPRAPAGADFTSYFLNESREGYCVHFATAATVLLRSLGLPARYAEGYIVVAADYEKTRDADGFIDIDDTHAHAWVEVFDPAQLEWIPVEMSPGNGDGMSSSTDEPPEGTATPTPTAEPTPTPEPTPEPTKEPTPSPDSTDNPAETPQTDAGALPSAEPEQTDDPTPEDTDGEEPEPSPNADGGGEDGEDGEDGADGVPPEARIRLLLAVCACIGLILLLIGLREALRAYRKRRLAQADATAAVRYACRLVLAMLRSLDLEPLDPLEAPPAYARYAADKLPGPDYGALERLIELSQQASFSDRGCTKRDCAEAVACLRSLSEALPHAVSWLRRCMLFLFYPRLTKK